MKPTLQHALELARAGDQRGYSAIYAELAGSVTRFAHARGADDPEGLTNEVFLAAFRTLDTFEGDEDNLRGWIFTIARNKAIDDARRRGRRPVIADADTPDGESPGSDEDVLARLESDWVLEQLSPLTEGQREVLLMRLVGGLTIAEIAEILDREIGAVKALQRRAIRRLQKYVSKDPYRSRSRER